MRFAHDLVARAGQSISRYSMLQPGQAVGVAVSGGADSVVLLHILRRLIGTLAIHLKVLHVNHGLRGAESDADEQFVRDLAGTLGFEFVGTRALPASGNLEQEARRSRREFFLKCRRERLVDRVAMGHTLTDQAETVLYRFLRGSGLSGLAGMRPVTQDGIVRPLLAITRGEIRNWGAVEGIAWREDSSNVDGQFARNRLRNRIIPLLESDFNRNLTAVLAGMADVAGAEEDYWQDKIDGIFGELATQTPGGLQIKAADLRKTHLAVQRRILRRAIVSVRGDLRSIDLKHIDGILAICESCHGHDRVLIPGVDAMRSFDMLLLARPGEMNLEPRNYRLPLPLNGRVELPFGAGTVELSVANSDCENCDTVKEDSYFLKEAVDLDLEAFGIPSSAASCEIRNWRPGDEMLRPGRRNPEKIKTLFQEHGVHLWDRRHWPVGIVNERVFWARSFGAAVPYAADSSSARVARLTYRLGGGGR